MNEPFLLSNLIELQEIDNKIYKLELDKKGSENVERLMALESEFNEVNKKIETQKNIMGSYFKDIEDILKTSDSILQKISSINIKLEDKSLDANELLNYTKQKESSQSQVSQLEKKKIIMLLVDVEVILLGTLKMILWKLLTKKILREILRFTPLVLLN